MRKIALSALVLAAIAFSTQSFQAPNPEPFKWYTWEEAVALNKTKPKKIVVDVFTNWCGWCKKMDKGAFSDPAVAAYIAANFYPVKLNAEQREEINFIIAIDLLIELSRNNSQRVRDYTFPSY